tara:strand:+ start:119 stop:562 length:444 start_codon:yes stop_codon:yes gene_type:complete
MTVEESIRRTIAKFANSFALGDWDLMESTLAKKLAIDYSDQPKETTGHEYAQGQREALELLNTQLILANVEIVVDGDQAEVRSSGAMLRVFKNLAFNTHSIYLFRLAQRENEEWVIDRIKQKVLWNEGDPNIHDGARNQQAPRRMGF